MEESKYVAAGYECRADKWNEMFLAADFIRECCPVDSAGALDGDDPLYDLMASLGGKYGSAYYSRLGSEIRQTGGMAGEFPAAVVEYLRLKADFAGKLKDAYLQGDKNSLQKILSHEIPELKSRTEKLHKIHHQLWLKNSRPFGWDTVETRYRRLIAFVENLEMQLEVYLSSNIKVVGLLDGMLNDRTAK